MRFNMNRTELKEWFTRVRNAQQDENLGIDRTRRRMLNETISPSIDQILSAIKETGSEDPSTISSYLGAHEDEVADMMASDDFLDAEAEMRYSADDGPFAETHSTIDLKQTGQTTPEEYLMSEIVAAAWEAGARWALGGPTIQADRAAADLEDGIMQGGVLIPPVKKDVTLRALEALYRELEQKKASGDYEDEFSRQLSGADDQDYADYSDEYKEMLQGKPYDR